MIVCNFADEELYFGLKNTILYLILSVIFEKRTEMGRNRNHHIVSTLSDEQLASVLAADRRRNPSEFKSTSASGIADSKSFLHHTSARGINAMLKWL